MSQSIDPLEAAALDFHEKNPHVFLEIAEVCLRLRRAGQHHWGIKAAYEVVRYHAALVTTGRTYKLNNNHTAYYARWLMRDYPELSGFFSLRDHPRVKQEYGE